MATAFFTICSNNFLGRAITLFESVEMYHPEASFWIVLVDGPLPSEITINPAINLVNAEALSVPTYFQMTQKYNITEMNTAVKPFAFEYLFDLSFDSAIYLDPDTYLYSRLQEVEECFNSNVDLILTPHIIHPDNRGISYNQKYLQFGIYNLGFIALRNTPETQNALRWWQDALLTHCLIDIPNGLFVDQKWADLLPAFIERSRILRHDGYNVAYWNLHERTIERFDSIYYVNGSPLRFIHFSGLDISKNTVSRHSSELSSTKYSVFMELKLKYVTAITANNNEEFSRIEYAYSWNGFKEVNIHSPQLSKDADDKFSASNLLSYLKLSVSRIPKIFRAVIFYVRRSQNKKRLFIKSIQAFIDGDFAKIRNAMKIVNQRPRSPSKLDNYLVGFSKNRILFLDWSLPTPDRDAASVTEFQLLKILRALGQEVLFLPCNLIKDEKYARNLKNLGIECIAYPEVQSIDDWLKENARHFGQIWLSRGPVVYPYLSTIRKHAPFAKLVFNTVDLHYLREMRQAEVLKDSKLATLAQRTKEQEFDIIENTDATIVVSTREHDILIESFPPENIYTISLIYEDETYTDKGFEQRKDLIFIGSFDHSPNYDGLKWFLENVYPIVKNMIPEIRLHVIGQNPPKQLVEFADKDESISVHGFVPDINQFMATARISIAPLRYGAGVKGKVGLSMMKGLPVAASEVAVEGMGLTSNVHALVADEAIAFAENIEKLYTDRDLWNLVSLNAWKKSSENFSESAVKSQIENFLNELNRFELPKKPYFCSRSREEFDLALSNFDRRFQHKYILEDTIPVLNARDFTFQAFCQVCNSDSHFRTSFMYAEENIDGSVKRPNWREHLQCEKCNFVTRIRFALNIWLKEFRPHRDSRIYISEQKTNLYSFLSNNYDNLIGSEFVSQGFTSGEIYEGIRHENLEELSFPSESFDYLLSFDVLEHVYDYKAALKSIHSVLKQGGNAILTFPFKSNLNFNENRAVMTDRQIVHLLPPEYHGNPMDELNGSFCWRYYGWEILENLKAVGFSDAQVYAGWSPEYAYLGHPQIVVVATK